MPTPSSSRSPRLRKGAPRRAATAASKTASRRRRSRSSTKSADVVVTSGPLKPQPKVTSVVRSRLAKLGKRWKNLLPRLKARSGAEQ